MHSFFYLDLNHIFDNSHGLSYVNYGPLFHPIRSQSVKLTQNDIIELITISDANSTSNAPEQPAGTVRINTDQVKLITAQGASIELTGVQPLRNSTNRDYSKNTNERIEISSVHEIKCELQGRNDNDYQIEYLSNLKHTYLFPDFVDTTSNSIKKIDLISNNKSLKIETSVPNTNFSRSALYLRIDEIEFFLVSLDNEKINDSIIIYLQPQSEAVRAKIRNCLSFTLGRLLHYHGYAILNKNHSLVELFYKSKQIDVKKSLPTTMPSLLGSAYFQLQSDEVSQFVNSLYFNYDKYQLQHVFWGYWHALDAPLHMAGVHFGACIESFQSAYVSQHAESFPKKLIGKSEWKTLQDRATNIINELEIPITEKNILINKVSNLNQTPQSIITKRFFEQLGIKLSPLETAAWRERNNAAHGNRALSNNYLNQLRNIKVLKCLLHRMIIIATNASENYLDYYSHGLPVKHVSTAINES